MDITIVGAEISESRYLHIMRNEVYEDGTSGSHIHRMPKEILSLRAAEYSLDVEDPKVLDMVLLEHLILTNDLPNPHPLYSADTIEDAVIHMDRMMDTLRGRHGQPPEKFLAKAKSPSNGLVVAKALLLEHTDPRVIPPVQYFRDKERAKIRHERPKDLVATMRNTWMASLEDEARAEDTRH